MIAPIVWLLPICTQLRKCAAGDIVHSLTRLKKLGSELKFSALIFRKLDQINIWNRGKWWTSKIVRFFLTYISHTFRTIKPPCRAAINIFSTIVKKLENEIIHTNRVTWYMLKYVTYYQNALVWNSFKLGTQSKDI